MVGAWPWRGHTTHPRAVASRKKIGGDPPHRIEARARSRLEFGATGEAAEIAMPRRRCTAHRHTYAGHYSLQKPTLGPPSSSPCCHGTIEAPPSRPSARVGAASPPTKLHRGSREDFGERVDSNHGNPTSGPCVHSRGSIMSQTSGGPSPVEAQGSHMATLPVRHVSGPGGPTQPKSGPDLAHPGPRPSPVNFDCRPLSWSTLIGPTCQSLRPPRPIRSCHVSAPGISTLFLFQKMI
jgi:hypothetical protein